MFYPVEGGSVYEVPDNAFGFVFKCQLAPVGYGVDTITGKVGKTDVFERHPIDEENHWVRPSLPKDWNERRKREKERQKFDRYYYDPYCEEIRQKEWNRRRYGVWFHNYNPKTKQVELRYVTGPHYFYITYWKFQGKFMDFRIPDMEWWYIARYIETDPDALGGNEITKRKQGKCFGKGTLIRMYDGSVKPVEQIKNGELVMGDDSTPRVVSGVTSGVENLYKIIPKKGNGGFICNESHLLHVKFNGSKRVREDSKWQRDKTYNFTIPEYNSLNQSDKDHLVQYRKGWGSHFPENKHTLPPYILGAWLGDGKCTGAIISSADDEIINSFKGYCGANGLMIRHKKNYDYSIIKSEFKTQSISVFVDEKELKFDKLKDAHIFFGEKTNIGSIERTKYHRKYKVVNNQTKTPNAFMNSLRVLGLLGNKHIPNDYLIDSEANRLELLAGIIDTDGHLSYNRNGNPTSYEITQKREKLSYEIVELSRSLGFHTVIKQKRATMKRADGSLYECIVYRITIWGEIDRIPCRVERKKVKYIDGVRRKNSMNFGFRVEPIGEGEYYGFEVDGNHLFLLADGTVVHNTARVGCWIYERTSRPPRNQHGGLQSKADDDAFEVMKKAIVQPWQKLPDFFRPIYDTMKGDDPNELRFFHTSRRGSTAEEERDDEDALESWIDFKSSDTAAYDGPELDTYVADEAGKTKKPVSIKERQQVVRYCSEIDGVMKGKQWYTTTVEIEKGEEDNYEFQEMTTMSNPMNRDANNRTMTGLYTYFLPAFKGMNFDKYGYPDEERSLKWIMNTVDKLLSEGKTREASSFKRKNPINIKWAFSVDGADSLYNPELLQAQMDRISWGEKFTEKGDLKWVNGREFLIEKKDENGQVVTDEKGEPILVPNKIYWEANENGKYEKVVGWEPKEPNNIIIRNGLFIPNANYLYRIGCDPFRYDKTKDKRRSNCAAFAYQMPDPVRPDNKFDNIFGIRYSYRPESTKLANMDVLKMAWWCGCQVLFERNVNHWKEHFNQWKCSGFLMWLPNEVEPGVFTAGSGAGSLVQTLCNYTEAYINEHIDKVYYKTLLAKENGWLGFKVEDTQKFDEPMAAGITLLAVKGKQYQLPNQPKMSIEKLLPYRKAV